MTEMTPEDWGIRYAARRHWFESLTGRLHSLILDLLRQERIEVINVEARTKEVESFVGKISRKDVNFPNPLAEVTDLVGVRIITYDLEDVNEVGQLIRKEFGVDDTVSGDRPINLEPDRFGYTAVHYIVVPSSSRKPLTEWRQYADVRVEIQVRTALQHAWSAVHHKLDYKSTLEAPKELRRRLFRLSALFELADEEFSRLRIDRSRIRSGYEDGVRGGQLDISIDEASIAAYIQGSGKDDAVAQLAMRSGANITTNLDSKRLARDRRDLLAVLHWSGITTIEQLDGYLTANILSQSIPNGFFGDDRRSVEDALTVLIMTDMRADKNLYGQIYMPDGWDDFIAGVEAWHAHNRLPR